MYEFIVTIDCKDDFLLRRNLQETIERELSKKKHGKKYLGASVVVKQKKLKDVMADNLSNHLINLINCAIEDKLDRHIEFEH